MLLALAAWLLAPQQVTIVTPRGESVVPVSAERGVPAIAAPRLVAPLRLEWSTAGADAQVHVGQAVFRFALGAPYARTGHEVCSLVGAPYVARDTLFLPLEWLTDCVPRTLGQRFRWHAAAARLEETPAVLAAAPGSPPPATAPAPVAAPAATGGASPTPVEAAPHPLTGLRRRHTVMVDPGHGGRDPGNPGLHLPRGVTEKDVNLMVGRLLRAELERRGLQARMTRTTDTLVDFADRGRLCGADCDLFVSLHVNAMDGRRRNAVNGVETYFLSDAKTEDQRRVAKMENDAIRFETAGPIGGGDLGFIIRDLQQNEYLRESARLADLVQRKLAVAHPGNDRGVQQAGFLVLSLANRPAILVEMGFATNRKDAEFLAAAAGQRRIANAVADGIVAYLLEYERKLAIAGAGR
jgi:N-acetylmuramoyl-L-alanine amidase